MRKRFLSLLCVLALCLGLLPVTALAVAPIGQVLYVGGVQISSTGYWTTDSDGNVTASTAGETPTDNYISYDAENNVLTLHNATIKNELELNASIEGGTFISGSAIGVFNKSGNAELTISLVGTNTIANVGKGIFVLASSASTGSSNLTIQGDGSLNASASQTGIWVQSNGNNAALCVENAEVTASPDGAVKDGVLVQAKDGSDVSLTVNGGSLTASVNANIRFQFGSGVYGSGTPTVTVSNNAIVRANGGIVNNSSTSIQYGTGNKENGGIVWNGTGGTVYGNVTLQENLEIGEGESLTIGDGASLNTGSHEVIVNGGTLTGEVNGQQSPQITTPPQSQIVTEGESATFTIEASGSEPLSYQWQESTDSGSNWKSIAGATSTSYEIATTSTDMSDHQYRCVVTASGVSVVSDAATLTVNAPTTYTISADVDPAGAGTVKVNGSGTSATVEANSDVTLTATANEGYRFTGWTSSDGGTFTDASSESTTFTMPAGNVTVTAQFAKVVTGVKLDKETLALYTGDSATLTATVEPSDAANQNVTWQSDNANVATVQNGTVTAVGAGETTISVTTEDGGYTATCKVTVTRRSSGGTPTKTPSQQAVDKIEAAQDGDTVEITLRTGQTTLDKEVFEELSGRDVTLEVNLPGGITWTVNGKDIPADAALTDIDLGVSLNTSDIPVDVINLVTGEKGAVQMTLKHDGEFGFTMTLTAPLGVENKGLWANLYHYNTTKKQMLFETSAQVDSSGNVALKFSHASEYAIVLDEKSHELPFTDTVEGAWYQGAVEYVYRNGIMTGTSATTFEPGTTLSRAMVAQILYNLEGQPDISEENLGYPYSDVDAEAWYGDAVYWARINGVATGYEDNTFRPNKAVTREELAQMLYNYAQYKKIILPAMGDLSKFPDGDKVSSWAQTAMKWATGLGVINGYEDNTLRPGGSTTRAEAASMILGLAATLTK